jgi:DNA-binding winged helix-turn-helix (wHTH) protein/tetratricopeptide (TPR) repeat protein
MYNPAQQLRCKPTVSATHELLRFGVFELNLTTEELRKAGTLIKLSPQPFKLLALLASHSGQVVTREDIQQQIWGEETYVDFEQGMNHCIKQIRNALSDSADTPLYIETIPRRGYRFLAPVVSKTILAPAPHVVESQSGIQSGIAMPAIKLPVGPWATAPPKVPPEAALVLNLKKVVPPDVATPPPAMAATATAMEPGTHPRGAPGRRTRGTGLAVAALLLIAAVVGFLYWRSGKSAVLSERDTIVLADFDNTTGEPVFDSALKQALSVDLEQSPFLNVLSDQKVSEQLHFMGLPADTHLNEEVARQVCQRAGSKAVLLGYISGVGGHYLIGLNAVDCNTGDSLGSEQADAGSREQVLNALGKATRRMREKLGESLASVQKYDTPVEQATTPSLDALKSYSLGMKMGSTQGYSAAVPYFKSAIDLDPNFAMAYARLGVEYFNLNQPTLAAENATKAYQLRDHTSEREKLYIVSHYHDLVTGDADQTIAAYQLLQQAYPREQSSYMNLNSWYNAIGKYDQAMSEAQNGLQLDPGNVINYHNLAVTYIDLDRLDDAQAVLEQARIRKLADPALLADLYEVDFLRGNTAAMARQVVAATGKPGVEDQLLALQSDTEAYFGRLTKARELSQLAQASALHAGANEAAALWQLAGALHEAELGDPQRARQQATAALAAGPGKNVRILAALALARSGDRKRAQTLADELVKQYPSDTMVNDYWVPTIRAAIALDEKNPAAAIAALQAVASYEIGSPSPGIAFYPVYLRGLAYLQQGQAGPAAAQFQKMLDNRGVILNIPIAALAHLRLAQAQAMSGNNAAARKSYEDFLALWKDADPDLPILKQAQAQYAKLR